MRQAISSLQDGLPVGHPAGVRTRPGAQNRGEPKEQGGDDLRTDRAERGGPRGEVTHPPATGADLGVDLRGFRSEVDDVVDGFDRAPECPHGAPPSSPPASGAAEPNSILRDHAPQQGEPTDRIRDSHNSCEMLTREDLLQWRSAPPAPERLAGR